MLQAFDYDQSMRSLKVKFRNGDEVVLRDVPAGVAEELSETPSPGSYYHRHIKDRFQIAW